MRYRSRVARSVFQPRDLTGKGLDSTEREGRGTITLRVQVPKYRGAVPKVRALLRSSNKDPSVMGSILGSRSFGNSRIRAEESTTKPTPSSRRAARRSF